MPSILSTPQSVYEEDLAEETAEKKIKNQKIKKRLKKKNRTSFFFNFSKLTPKKMPRGTPSTPSVPSMCFLRGWSIRGCWKFVLQMCDGVDFFFFFNCLWKAEFLCQPISECWSRATILIPFLQAIKHFCDFIPSYFVKRFAFLIERTS